MAGQGNSFPEGSLKLWTGMVVAIGDPFVLVSLACQRSSAAAVLASSSLQSSLKSREHSVVSDVDCDGVGCAA